MTSRLYPEILLEEKDTNARDEFDKLLRTMHLLVDVLGQGRGTAIMMMSCNLWQSWPRVAALG